MKREEVFEQLDPPKGGLAALRSKMEERPRARYSWLALPTAAAVALAVIGFLILRPRHDEGVLSAARASGGTAEISLGIAQEPSAPVALAMDQAGTSALSEVPTRNPNVVFYWVDSTEWKQ